MTDGEAVESPVFIAVMTNEYVVFGDKPVNVTGLDVAVEGVASEPFNVNEYDVAFVAAAQLTVI